MTKKEREKAINRHIQKDRFADFMGADVEIVSPGHSRVTLAVTEDMTNFHGITHGGVVFSLSDMAFAAAGNSHGQVAVALNVSICFLNPSHVGDVLVAEAKEAHAGGRTALYDIAVYEQKTGKPIARSQDLVYRKKQWFVEPDNKQ